MALKVFLASSNEEIETMEKLAEWIEGFGHKALTWKDHDLFPLAGYLFNSLHQVAEEVDVAICIFSEDDLTWYHGDKTKSPRDNVLLEYGLFSGKLGEQYVAIARKSQAKIASDLDGVTYLDLNKERTAKNKLRQWLSNLNKLDDTYYEKEKLKSPFQSSGKKSLFEKGTEVIKGAQYRVALVAKTPIPIVGTRPYGEPNHSISYEEIQFKEYFNLIERTISQDIEFRCIGSLCSLVDDLQEINTEAFQKEVKKNLIVLDEKEKGSSFSLGWCDIEEPITFVVADNTFLLWFKDSSGENVWITAENESISRALWDKAEKLLKSQTLNNVLIRLGLE